MPVLKCPHCSSATEFASSSESQTITCENCGKSIRVKGSVRSSPVSGSPADAQNPFVFSQSKPKPAQKPLSATDKAELPPSPAASKQGLPDFAAIAAAVPSSLPAGGFPDFSAIGNPSRPASQAKASASPQAAPQAAPGSAENDLPAVNAAAKASGAKVASEEKSGSAAKADKPQPADQRKTSSAADELAGFREFAALASGASAASSIAPSFGSASVAAKSEMPSESAGATGESATTETSGSAKMRDKHEKSEPLSGRAWLPAAADGTAVLLFATAVYQAYGIYTDAISIIPGISIMVALTAAGVAMLMLSLAVRLISQISLSQSQSKSDSSPGQL